MKLLTSVAAALTAVVLGGSASAAVFTATYTGTVRGGTIITGNGDIVSGIDHQGLFGAVGANLVGQSYTAVYTIDDTAPGTTFSENPGAWSQVIGPNVLGAHPQGPVTLAFSLNGVTINIGDNAGQAYQSALPLNGYNQVFHSAGDLEFGPGGSYVETTVNNSIGDAVHVITTSYRYDTPLSYVTQPGDDAFGDFIVSRTGSSGVEYLTYLLLTPNTVNIAAQTTPGGVPEPSQWLLMIAGFGVVGAGLRLKKGRIAPAR